MTSTWHDVPTEPGWWFSPTVFWQDWRELNHITFSLFVKEYGPWWGPWEPPALPDQATQAIEAAKTAALREEMDEPKPCPLCHESQPDTATIIRNLLRSADSIWFEQNMGHDWRQAVIAAERFLESDASKACPLCGESHRDGECVVEEARMDGCHEERPVREDGL